MLYVSKLNKFWIIFVLALVVCGLFGAVIKVILLAGLSYGIYLLVSAFLPKLNV